MRPVKTNFHVGRFILAISLAVLAAVSTSPNSNAEEGSGSTPSSRDKPNHQYAEVPFFLSSHDRLDGVLAKRDYLIRLPEHVRFEAGSEILLTYRSSPLLMPDVSTLSVRLNDRELTSVRLGSQKGASSQDASTLRIPISAGMLLPGWNRISLGCLLQTTEEMCRDVDNPAAWLEVEAGSALRLSYSTVPLFPEIPRFPHAMTEPQLLVLSDCFATESKKSRSPLSPF